MTFPAYPILATPITPPTLPDGTVPLPVWAYGNMPAAAKADPGDTKRALGWTTVPDQTFGEEPPFQWQNNEMFNNGQWASFFKAVADYLKEGNFDNGINVTGNSTFNNRLNVTGPIIGSGGIVDQNRSGIFFKSSDGNNYSAFYANSDLTSDQTYSLPINYPTVNNQSLICDISGNMRWGFGSVGQSNYTNGSLISTSSYYYNICSLTLDPGIWLLSSTGGLNTTSIGANFIRLGISLTGVGSGSLSPPSDWTPDKYNVNHIATITGSAGAGFPAVKLCIPMWVINSSTSFTVYAVMAGYATAQMGCSLVATKLL